MTNENSCFNYQITLLKSTGIWPANSKSITVKILQQLILYIQTVTLILISFALILGAFFSEDLKNVSSSVDIVTLTISAIYKAWFVTLHIEKFENLIEFMEDRFKATISNENGDVISVKEKNKNCSFHTSLLCLSGALVMVVYSIVPFLENSTAIKSSNSTEELFRTLKFPLMSWAPFNIYWSPMYEFVYVMNSFSLFASANIYLTNDSFFFMMIYQVCIQLQMLSKMMANIAKGRMDYMNENSNLIHPRTVDKSTSNLLGPFVLQKNKTIYEDIDHERMSSSSDIPVDKADITRIEMEIESKLKKCISFHGDLLRVIVKIEELYRSMILADILHALISLSFALHETGVADSFYNRIKMYTFLIVCIVHQLGNSYFGQMLINAQGLISEAAYNCRWYDANIRTKKYMILIIARSNKFTMLSAEKMYYLHFQSFIMLMKTIFSYYMVLRQASNK